MVEAISVSMSYNYLIIHQWITPSDRYGHRMASVNLVIVRQPERRAPWPVNKQDETRFMLRTIEEHHGSLAHDRRAPANSGTKI